MLGQKNTSSVTMEDMIHHCKAVVQGTSELHPTQTNIKFSGSSRSFIVCDMPYGSYEVTSTDAVKNAIRLVKGTEFSENFPRFY